MIDSPNTVKLYGYHKYNDDTYFLDLELCNGGELIQLIRAKGSKLSEAEALVLLR